MPRNPPHQIFLSAKDKAFVYQTLKTFGVTLRQHADKKALIKLALKFPPGSSRVRLQDWEKTVIVSWLLKLHNLAKLRQEAILEERLKVILGAFK